MNKLNTTYKVTDIYYKNIYIGGYTYNKGSCYLQKWPLLGYKNIHFLAKGRRRGGGVYGSSTTWRDTFISTDKEAWLLGPRKEESNNYNRKWSKQEKKTGGKNNGTSLPDQSNSKHKFSHHEKQKQSKKKHQRSSAPWWGSRGKELKSHMGIWKSIWKAFIFYVVFKHLFILLIHIM